MFGEYNNVEIVCAGRMEYTRTRFMYTKYKKKVVPHSLTFLKPIMLKQTEGKEAQTRATILELIQRHPNRKTDFLQRHNLDEDMFKYCYVGVLRLELADEKLHKIQPKLNALEE